MCKYSQVSLSLAMLFCCEFRQGEIYLEAEVQTPPVQGRAFLWTELTLNISCINSVLYWLAGVLK